MYVEFLDFARSSDLTLHGGSRFDFYLNGEIQRKPHLSRHFFPTRSRFESVFVYWQILRESRTTS